MQHRSVGTARGNRVLYPYRPAIATELTHLPAGDRPARVALAARFVVSALAS
ncbi:hypothetical protein [Rhodococcus sp. BP22]|uniref:hypothetical protein n=1 Tax=Rhodococcus sp. BP22 TaxID=2758566 RepID=UPI001645FA6E|nr:hypothetical protein [Rhodococcus sp. BP22]